MVQMLEKYKVCIINKPENFYGIIRVDCEVKSPIL